MNNPDNEKSVKDEIFKVVSETIDDNRELAQKELAQEITDAIVTKALSKFYILAE